VPLTLRSIGGMSLFGRAVIAVASVMGMLADISGAIREISLMPALVLANLAMQAKDFNKNFIHSGARRNMLFPRHDSCPNSLPR
jgi:hypothetical protein